MSEPSHVVWHRSARCVSDHHCVEVANFGDAVGLRNSQRPEHSLTFAAQAWQGFIEALKSGHFDTEQY